MLVAKILVKRLRLRGDVIMALPLIERLARDGHDVIFMTMFPELVELNPHISAVIKVPFGHKFRLSSDLSLSLSNLAESYLPDASFDLDYDCFRPPEPIRESFFKIAGVTPEPGDISKHTMVWSEREHEIVSSLKIKPDRVLIHVRKRQQSERLAALWWPRVVTELRDIGLEPYAVGAGDDYAITGCDTSLFGRLSSRELALLVSESPAIACHDSFPMHCAGLSDKTGVFAVFDKPGIMPEMLVPPVKSVLCVRPVEQSDFDSLENEKRPSVITPEGAANLIARIASGEEIQGSVTAELRLK